MVTSATEAKSGARELGSTGPGSAAPERDRLGEVAALVGGLVRIQVRVVRLQEAAPARHELARRTLVRQAEQAEEPLRLVGAWRVGRAPAAPGLGGRLRPALRHTQPPAEVAHDLRVGRIAPPGAREPLAVEAAEEPLQAEAQLGRHAPGLRVERHEERVHLALVERAPHGPPRVDGLADPRMEPPEERSCVGCLLYRHQPAPAREREMASPGALVNGDLLQASGAPGGAEVAVARRGEYAPERHESASAACDARSPARGSRPPPRLLVGRWRRRAHEPGARPGDRRASGAEGRARQPACHRQRGGLLDRLPQSAGGGAGRARALRRGAGGEARRPPLRARRASVRGGAPAGRGEPGPGPRAGRDRARGGQSLRAPREGRRRLPGRGRSGERPRGLAGGRRGGRPGRGRERPHPAPVLLDRLADRRADRRDPGARGQRREGQRDGARGDQPAPPDLRRVRGAAAGAGRDPRAHGGRGAAGGGLPPRGLGPPRRGHTQLHQQHGRHGERHGAPEGDLPQRERGALARAVRHRDAPPRHPPRRRHDSQSRRADGPGREVRLRRAAGRDGRFPPGQRGAGRGRGGGRRAGNRGRRAGGDRGAAAPRPGRAGAGEGGGMSMSASFIRRPVATTLVMLAVLLFGAVAYRSLPVSDLPNVDLPTLLVSASLPGASPETMASSVATPLERQFSTIAGLSSMNSVNTLGGTQITLQFDLSRNIDAAAQDVQAAITLATPLLPPSMPTPPVYRKVNPADQPILFLALTSPTLPLWTLDEYGETLMAQRISMVGGVAQVQVYGAQKYAVRVRLDPDALASRGIGIDEVAKAIQGANVNLPTGTLYGSHRAFTVEATGQLTSAEPYRPVIFASLRNVSATIIPSLALPLSVVGTFAAMQPLGYSLDNLSLMALTLSIGFVVDDAIVILENIVRHMEMGKAPLEAAYDGAAEIGFTILSMTLSLAAVFIPVLFMPGILGRLFHEFAVTICVAILISGCVSLTLTPMLCARYLRPPAEARHGRLFAATERAFDGLLRGYERSLGWVLRHRPATMGVSLALLAVTGLLFVHVPKGFIPNEDQGFVFTVVEAAEGVSFEQMTRLQLTVTDIVRADPSVEELFSSISASSASTGSTLNQGRMFLHLRPRAERPSADEVIQGPRPQPATVPGVRVFMQVPPIIRIGGQLTKSLYQFTLQSPDTQALYQAAPRLEARLRALRELQDVTSDLQIKSPQVNVVIDRDKASTLGVSAEQIEDALFDAYGNRWVSTIYAPTNQYKVSVEVEPQYQRDAAALSRLYVRSASGQLVPLGG